MRQKTDRTWTWLEIGLLAISLLAGLYVAFGPVQSVLNWYANDDAYYYFKVAANITSGHGMTFDGLNPTNGFHPLWMLVCIPVFWLAKFDLVLPLRVLVVLSSLLGAGTGILLFRLLRRAVSPWVAATVAILWTFVPSVHSVIVQQGLESTLNAFTLVWLLSLMTGRQTERFELGRAVGVGIVAGLAILARLDNIFLVMLLGVWFILDTYAPYLRNVIVADLGWIFSAGMLGYFIKLGTGAAYVQNSASLPWLLGLGFILYPLAFLIGGLYAPPRTGRWWKFIRNLGLANLAATTLLGGLLLGLQAMNVYSALPRSVILIDGALMLFGSLAWRLAVNAFHGKSDPTAADVPPVISWDFWKAGIRQALAYFVPVATLLGSYMVWSYLSVGLWMPVSGQVKRWWGGLAFTIFGPQEKSLASLLGFEPGGAWSLALSPIDFLKGLAGRVVAPGAAFLLTFLLVAGAVLVLLIARRERIAPLAERIGLFPWFIGAYAHIFYYTTTSYMHTRPWYWVSEMLLALLFAALVLECLWSLGGQKKAWLGIRFAVLILCSVGSLAAFTRMMVQEFPYQTSAENAYLYEVRALEANTEPGALIGMTGSGEIGYFIQDRTVVNLDGLINSPEYFHSISTGQGQAFLSRLGLDYIYGNATMLTETSPYQEMFARNVELVKEIGEMTLYRFIQGGNQ